MKTTKSNILCPPNYVDAICIPTNQILKVTNQGVWGKGLALSAKEKWPDLPKLHGQFLKKRQKGTTLIKRTLHPNLEQLCIYSFPTRIHWKDKSNLNLIEQSARELIYLTDYNKHEEVWLPVVGCELGGLKFNSEVGPLLGKLLDDRFTIVFKSQLAK